MSTIRLMLTAAWCALGTSFSGELQPQSAALVDHHQHLFSPVITASSPDLQPVSADDLIALLDRAGIQRAAVLSLAYQFGNPNKPPVEDEYSKVKAENDWTSKEVARFPDRLRGFCAVNPLKEYALREVTRCAGDPHLRVGLKLHLGNSDIQLDNPEHIAKLRQVLGAANRNRMAVVVHMRPSVTRQRPYGAAQAQIFLDSILPAAPDVPVQIAHLAGAGGYDDPTDEALAVFVAAIAEEDPRAARLYFDVSGIAGLGEWTEKADLIAARIRRLGVRRILYGSDGTPEILPPDEAHAAFRQLPLSDAEFRTILSNRAPYMR